MNITFTDNNIAIRGRKQTLILRQKILEKKLCNKCLLYLIQNLKYTRFTAVFAEDTLNMKNVKIFNF